MSHDTLAVHPTNPNPFVALPTGPRKWYPSHLLSVQITGRASRESDALPIAPAKYPPFSICRPGSSGYSQFSTLQILDNWPLPPRVNNAERPVTPSLRGY